MLELRPCCENCGVNLPHDSSDAMICSFECTFCSKCVKDILNNCCPNCGGEFVKRPKRPTHLLAKYPMKTERFVRPVK